MTTPDEIRDGLRALALTLPEAHEDGPWGESVVKVRNRIFLFLGTDGAPDPGFGVKLPESHEEALTMPGIVPAGYGLGKAGWVNVALTAGSAAEPELYREWVIESYRAVAPKRLAAALDALDDAAS
jgi:predicted DNA-binding protein (MmcQ/YjbR family)